VGFSPRSQRYQCLIYGKTRTRAKANDYVLAWIQGGLSIQDEYRLKRPCLESPRWKLPQLNNWAGGSLVTVNQDPDGSPL
jgi:hypothetical protein